MRLTHHYSGHNICAPSRYVLMTGKHPGHAYIRSNRGGFRQADLKGDEGQEPVPSGELKLPLMLKQRGYINGGFGKWGLGGVGSTGDPNSQGMDRFFGYNDQGVAHNFYPVSLWNNRERVPLRNARFSARQKLPASADPQDPASYAKFTGKDYAPDLINEAARTFLRENKDRPFFLYYPTTVPHLALQVPEDSLAEYKDVFPEEPYTGGDGYLPHRTPRAAYAAMVTRLDREIGKLLALVDDFALREDTIVVFTSDNGPLWERYGGTDSEFFNSHGGLRDRKGSYYEGGFRVPCIVRWTAKIKPGTTSERVTGFEDWLPTILELAGAKERTPSGIDGISLAPTLLGRTQPERPFLYREAPDYGASNLCGSATGRRFGRISTRLRRRQTRRRARSNSTTLRLIRPSRGTLPSSIPRSSRDSRRFYESNTCPRSCGRFGRWTRRHLGGDFLTAAPNCLGRFPQLFRWACGPRKAMKIGEGEIELTSGAVEAEQLFDPERA